ncbi:MAG TPA: nitrate reductase molybdenum cofactor assembly chaperone [Hyphomicrobiaceae bacterium]|jgi:nitrate reductase delta subunit|nr:nitrate reductase molybdenum cofactor assembly chaperone [Hyphomicrobiaceae bacterium]
MKRTLKVLSALLSYPTAELQAAVPEMRAALDAEARLPQRNRDRLDRILEELATGDLYDLQERYVLLFDRTRSLSLHLFEHVHGESRDRGQAMVDLKQLYEGHGLYMSSSELPDHLPLFLEFLSQIPESEACSLLGETAHVLEAIRQRLKKRKAAYSSVFSCAQAVAEAQPQTDVVAALMGERDEDPNDLAALDAAWEEEEVTFGPAAAAAAQCGKDGLAAKLRAGRRPAQGMPVPEPVRPIITYTPSNRA